MSTNGATHATSFPRPRSATVFDGPDRAHARAYMKGIGFDDDALSRPTIGIANTWTEAMPCNFHLRALAEHIKDGRARRRRHADGVQHRRRLRRGDDGHPGDEGLADQPRGDRRLDRADGPRLPVRRDRRPLRLRQDDPRLRDGAGPARRALGAALRRLDRPRPLARPRRHDPRHLRGDRRPQRRRDDRRGTARARGRRQPRRRRLRRPVHRQHDGLRLRGAGDQRRRLGDGAGRRRRQGRPSPRRSASW